VALAPDGLPDNLIETLFAIEEMANEEGQERLEAAATQAGLDLKFDEKSSHGDIAVQVFLAKPELLAEKHNEQRLIRLATFEYFGSKKPEERGQRGDWGHGRTLTHTNCSRTRQCWICWWRTWTSGSRNTNRGEQTASVEVFAMDGEFWFLVRHGDTFARTAKAEKRKTEIHTASKAERELCRTEFGQRLRGDATYFSDRKNLCSIRCGQTWAKRCRWMACQKSSGSPCKSCWTR